MYVYIMKMKNVAVVHVEYNLSDKLKFKKFMTDIFYLLHTSKTLTFFGGILKILCLSFITADLFLRNKYNRIRGQKLEKFKTQI